MTGQEYQAEVLRTYALPQDQQTKFVLAALGLTGESGEVADQIKKSLYGHSLDPSHLKEELGDVLWYLALACDALGCTLEEVMQLNVEKLRKRYPHGFELERSLSR